MLDVRGGPGHPLQTRASTSERRIRSLDDGDPLIAGLLQAIDQAQAVVAQQNAVRIEGQQVVAVRDHEVGVLAELGEDDPFRAVINGEASAHETEVGVEVHGLVRLVGQRDVTLALERGDLGAERALQTLLQLVQPVLLHRSGLGDRHPQSSRYRLEIHCQPSEDLGDHEFVSARVGRVCVLLCAQPTRRKIVFVGDHEHLIGAGIATSPDGGAGEHRCRLGQPRVDLLRKRAAAFENHPRMLILGLWRVVDEQDDANVGELLQRRGDDG